MAEQITLLRRLRATESVDFDGRFDVIEGAGINPRSTPWVPAGPGRRATWRCPGAALAVAAQWQGIRPAGA